MKTVRFNIGQVWSFDNRPGENDATITILDIEEVKDAAIIHVRIDGVKIFSPGAEGGYTGFIGHLPFSENAIARSVTKFLGQIAALPDYSDGYNQWKQAFDNGRAGYWKIGVAEVIERIDNMAQEKNNFM